MAFKGIKPEEKWTQGISKYLFKAGKLLPHFQPDLASFNILVRKNNDTYHHSRKRHHAKDYVKTKPALARFEGWIRLLLPKKVLYSHFKGATIEEGVRTGIGHLTKEIKKYKDLHFKSQSRYPDHRSIRKGDYA